MEDSDEAAEIADLKARLESLEARRAQSEPEPAYEEPVHTVLVEPKRKVGILLFIGIVIAPYIFAWLTLRKGYSQTAKVVSLGWMAIMVLAIMVPHQPVTSAPGSSTTAVAPNPVDPHRHEKDVAAAVAKMEVPKFMKDPSSAQFGQVWGISKYVACGEVNGKNSFGGFTGNQKFIYAMGSAEFEGHSGFIKHWNTLCVEKLLSAGPAGFGSHHWGSGPTSDMKSVMPATDDQLIVYKPVGAPAPLEGVPVKEQDFRFDHHHLYAVDFYIFGDENRELVKTALVKKFGTPLTYDEAVHSYSWKWPGKNEAIEMSYNETQKETTVTYSHGEH